MAKKKSAAKKTVEPEVAKKIFAQASPRSIGGVSMFETQETINAKNVADFMSDSGVVDQAAAQLEDAGFEILQITPTLINISGTAKTYERAFQTKIVAEERSVIKEQAKKDTATFMECPDTS